MPPKFYEIASRIDHVLSAALSATIDKLNISQWFDFSIKFPTSDNDSTRISINKVEFQHTLLSYEPVSYGNFDQLAVDYGFTSICSLYRNNLNTLVQKSIEVNEDVKRENSLNEEVLFVAECSDKPRLAIFVTYKNNSNDFSQVKVFTGGHFFTMKADNEPVIDFNGAQHNIKESTFEYPQFNSDFK